MCGNFPGSVRFPFNILHQEVMVVVAEDSGNIHTPDISMDVDQDSIQASDGTNGLSVASSKSTGQNPIQQKIGTFHPTHSLMSSANQESEISATPPISAPGHPPPSIQPEQPSKNAVKTEQEHMDIQTDSPFFYWTANRETENWWNFDSEFFMDTDDPSYAMQYNYSRPSEPKKMKLPKSKRTRLHDFHLRLREKVSSEMFGESFESSEDDHPHRPSDIVKGYDEEDSDVDFPKEERKWSRRRRCATALKLSLMRRNMVHPCTPFELERYGLKMYGPHLKAPPKDRNIKKDKYYHRFLFRRQHPRYRRKYRKINEKGAGCESQASCGGNFVDTDYFEPSGDEADIHAKVLKSKPRMSEHYFGEGVVEDKDIPREKRVTIMSAGKLIRCSDVRAKPKKPPHVLNPHFHRLLDIMATDPTALFADLDEDKKDTKDENEKKDEKKPDDDDCDEWWSSDDEQTMPVFEWMKRDISEKFYTASKASKRKKKEKRVDPEALETVDLLESPESNYQPVSGMNFSSNFSMKYLMKLNFKGRLGKSAQGIDHIITPMNVSSGAGIGSRRLQEQNNNTSIAAQLARVQPVNFKELRAATQRRPRNPKKRSRSPVRKRVKNSEKLDDGDGMIYLDVEPATLLPPDNRRRAVLLDLDSCFVNAHVRRLKAFQTFIERCPEFPNAEAALFSPHGELSDRCVVKALMKKHGMETEAQDIDKMLSVLDTAFKSSGPLELDTVFLEKIREWSNVARIGVLHLGTSNRMNDELELSGLERIIVPSARIQVEPNDIAPYVGSWRELLVRVGVPACQSVFFIPDRNLSLCINGVIASKALGSRSFVKVDTLKVMSKSEDGKPGPYIGKSNRFGADCAMYTKLLVDSRLNLVVFLRKQRKRKPKHVQALRVYDQLWHSAVEFFRSSDENQSQADVFVRFDIDGQLEWVPAKHVCKLSTEGFLKFKENGFDPQLDPEAVNGLEIKKAKK